MNYAEKGHISGTHDGLLYNFTKNFDVVRIINPVKKSVINYARTTRTNESCYRYWGSTCERCISMLALKRQDVFLKMEFIKDKLFIVIAAPLEDGQHVLELIKDITHRITFNNLLGKNIDVNYLLSRIEEINSENITDELTGIFNKRYMNGKLPIELAESQLTIKPVSILMADIDNFKLINDRYGHQIGDQVIKEIASVLVKSLRVGLDWVARYGGEEFLIVLNNSNREEAVLCAECIRKVIEETPIKTAAGFLNVTLSFGISTFGGEINNLDKLIADADRKLYRAKGLGRNRICS